jgi:hypothetical protein
MGVVKEPPANTPRVTEEHDDKPYLPVNKSPKSRIPYLFYIIVFNFEKQLFR